MKIAYLLLCFSGDLVKALTVQELFIVPDGSEPDFSDTYYRGQVVPLQWNALNNTHDDLWVTSFDYTIHHYHQIIARGIDLSVDGSYNWNISIPSTVLAADAKYVLRFKRFAQPRTAYSALTLELSSPGILILNSYTSSRPSSASTSTSLATKSSSVAAKQPSRGAAISQSSGSLSVGAEAGIGVGVGLGALVVLGTLLYLFLRYRKVLTKKSNEAPPAYTSEAKSIRGSMKCVVGPPISPAELKGSSSPHELA